MPLSAEEQQQQAEAPDKLALGVQGGFALGGPPKHRIEKERALVVFPGRQSVPLPCPDLPEIVLRVIDAVVVSRGCARGIGCFVDGIVLGRQSVLLPWSDLLEIALRVFDAVVVSSESAGGDGLCPHWVVLGRQLVPLSCPDLPEVILRMIDAVMVSGEGLWLEG